MRATLWGLVLLLVAGLGASVRAQGFTQTYALDAGTVTVSNRQANSSWVPVAVLFRYDAAASGTNTVRRVSQGVDVLLDTLAFTNVSSVVWVAPAAFPFGEGDALVVTSSATNGMVQLLGRGE